MTPNMDVDNMDVEVMQPVIENVLRQLFQRAELFWVRGFFDVKVLLPIPVCICKPY